MAGHTDTALKTAEGVAVSSFGDERFVMKLEQWLLLGPGGIHAQNEKTLPG